MDRSRLPVVVIGGGPVGLAAAAHLVDRGETPVVLEAGNSIAASVQKWAHVQLFTPWRYAVDGVAVRLLEAAAWRAPDPEGYPTGAELVTEYLAPLAALPQIAPHIRLGHRVVAITRHGFDKMKTIGRDGAPFLVTVHTADGGEDQIEAKAVIDASGTYHSPNPLGAYGLPARNERRFRDRIFYGIPDILGADRARYAGKTVLVAGSGASAFNALLDLARLSEEAPTTRVIWVVRRALTGQLYGGGAEDQLPARGALGQRVRAFVERGTFEVATGFRIEELQGVGAQIAVHGDGRMVGPVDEIIVTTGFRPDLSILSEVRLALDPGVESPVALAPLIDPNFHSCGTVRPHGVEELKHPEQDLYIIGSKSYGRAPTFLLLTGYEQARSVVAAIAGDWEAARQVQLVLPETGVCSRPIDAEAGGWCCGVEEPALAADKADLSLTLVADGSYGASSCCAPALATPLSLYDSAAAHERFAGESPGRSCCG
jgi:thioredoxin reductase